MHPSTAHAGKELVPVTFRLIELREKNERAARHERKRLVHLFKVLGQPVSAEVRSKAQNGENKLSAKAHLTTSFY